MTKEEFIAQFKGEIALNQRRPPYHPEASFAFRRGTAVVCETYVGKLNEMIYSTDDKTFHLCDGETPGGIIHLKLADKG